MDYMNNIIKTINQLKGDKSISEIAKECKIPQQSMSRYMLNKNEIKVNNLCALADYFDITLDELVGRK